MLCTVAGEEGEITVLLTSISLDLALFFKAVVPF